MDALQLANEVIRSDARVRVLLLDDVTIHRVRMLVEARAPGVIEYMKKHRGVAHPDDLPQHEYDRLARDRTSLIAGAVDLICAAIVARTLAAPPLF